MVTSAEEFLTSRTASFETGWQADQARAFWDEAIERLRRRPKVPESPRQTPYGATFLRGFKGRLQSRTSQRRIIYRLSLTMNIDPVLGKPKGAMLSRLPPMPLTCYSRTFPHVARISIACLARLRDVLTERRQQWKNLSRLLQSSFASVRQRLRAARQGIPTTPFTVETIVTPQAISNTHGPTLRKVEGVIRDALKRTARQRSHANLASGAKALQGEDAQLVSDEGRSGCGRGPSQPGRCR